MFDAARCIGCFSPAAPICLEPSAVLHIFPLSIYAKACSQLSFFSSHPPPLPPTSSRTMSSALDSSTFCGCVSAARAGVVLLEYSLFHATSPPCAPILPSSCPSFSLPAGVCLDGEIVGEVYLDNIYSTV